MPKSNTELKPPAKAAVEVQDRDSRSSVSTSAARLKASGTTPIPADFAFFNFRVARALALIESDYGVPHLNLDHISGRLNITKPHLCRIFRRDVGIGLPEYVRRVRAQKAEKLLKDTVLSIKEITAAVGFAHGTQLDRAFKAVYGCSPKEYRTRALVRASECRLNS